MGLITMWVERHDLGATGSEWAGISRLERGLIGAQALWFYLGKLIWPHPLMFMYPRWTVRAAYPAPEPEAEDEQEAEQKDEQETQPDEQPVVAH